MHIHVSDVIYEVNTRGISVSLGYGDEYYVGTYQKTNMLLSMVSTTISLLVGFWVTVAFESVVGVASSFVFDYLLPVGVSSVITAYIKHYLILVELLMKTFN